MMHILMVAVFTVASLFVFQIEPSPFSVDSSLSLPDQLLGVSLRPAKGLKGTHSVGGQAPFGFDFKVSDLHLLDRGLPSILTERARIQSLRPSAFKLKCSYLI